jgi:hypothetical protein
MTHVTSAVVAGRCCYQALTLIIPPRSMSVMGIYHQLTRYGLIIQTLPQP